MNVHLLHVAFEQVKQDLTRSSVDLAGWLNKAGVLSVAVGVEQGPFEIRESLLETFGRELVNSFRPRRTSEWVAVCQK